MADKTQTYREAVLWDPAEEKKTQCRLCAWRCLIQEGRLGICHVRKNIDGVLYSLNYHRLCAAAADPIEKKPLFHFQPGTKSFSIAAPGCNFRCVFCQNWQISQTPYDGVIDGADRSPQQLVEAALRAGCASIAYTYTEPTIFMELAAETGRLARARGLANVFVSNGYLTPEAIDFARPWLDAINIDLKAFNESFYKELCKARLQPVKDAIRIIAKETDIWLELTTLIIPGQNDSDDELRAMAAFIAEEVSADTPWHVSRFYPQYMLTQNVPTAEETLERAYEIGKAAGLRYIYIGNLPGIRAESTYCPSCSELLIDRVGYVVRKNTITVGL
jgi:pyruvate formate lyase activating enzyme